MSKIDGLFGRKAAQEAAQALLHTDFIIIDTETTGFSKTDQVIQFSALSRHALLLNVLIKPSVEISAESILVHGIDQEAVENAVIFPDIYPAILSLFKKESPENMIKTIIAYNADFDIRLINQTAAAYGLPLLPERNVACAMKMYAEYYGEMNAKTKSYKWQKLEGGDHSAAGDCIATLNLIKQMANGTAKTHTKE
jgi:DNA polymerase-3 subunit epsilon